ncbi:hypothetical protein [Paenibacillus elgii]|uniref:hypothetical protein n=1 Tax=Paenibacillus elgii TaxID=189691 RepID=UPI000248D20E|nr:hypothetical protein [Paenibacillus elgii]
MSKITIELPANRSERIKFLESELTKYKREELTESNQDQLKSLFQEEDIREKIEQFNLTVPSYLSVEFYSEYDDEGGYDKKMNNFYLYDVDMNDITDTYKEAKWSYTSEYSGKDRTTSVYDWVREGVADTINGDAEEIYEYLGDDYEFDIR